MVLASPDETSSSRRQRILLKRQQAMRANEQQVAANLEQDNDESDTQADASEENSTKTEDENDETHDNKRPKLDIPDDATIVANVYRFLDQEYKFMKLWNTDSCNLRPLTAVLQRTAAATGFSKRYVSRVLRRNKLQMDKNKRDRRQRQRIEESDDITKNTEEI